MKKFLSVIIVSLGFAITSFAQNGGGGTTYIQPASSASTQIVTGSNTIGNVNFNISATGVSTSLTATAVADTTLFGAIAASKYRVYGFSCMNSGTTNCVVLLKDGPAGKIMFYGIAPAGGGFVKTFALKTPIIGSTNSTVVVSNLTASTTLYYNIQAETATATTP